MIDDRRTIEWRSLTKDVVAALPATLGVYEIADDTGGVVDIGYAGAGAVFGLRTMLEPWLERPGNWQFCYEITSSYLTRYRELVLVHQARHGNLPELVRSNPERVTGRLQP
jgi:hypothetical protein